MAQYSDIKKVVREARKYYPWSKTLQRQWIKAELYLTARQMRADTTGGWKTQQAHDAAMSTL